MSKLVSDIRSYKNLEDNIPCYVAKFCMYAKAFAGVHLLLNKVNLMQCMEEMQGKAEINRIYDSFIELCKKAPEMGVDEAIAKLEEIRNDNVDVVTNTTRYIENYSIYQMVFNRIEGRFREVKLDKMYNDEIFLDKVSRSIAKANENKMANALISKLVCELPVMLTREKFREYLDAGISIYSQSTKQSFDSFLEMLRYNAVVDELSDKDTFKTYKDILDSYAEIKFKDIDEETFLANEDKLYSIADKFEEASSVHVVMQEAINDLYVCLIANKLCNEKVAGLYFGNKVDMKKIDEYVSMDCSALTDEELDKILEGSEGLQEEYYDKVSDLVGVFDEGILKEAYGKVTLKEDNGVIADADETLEGIRKLVLLLSNSEFVSLEKEDEADNKTVDPEYFEKKKNEVVDEIINSLSGKDRMVKKAIMGNVLGSIPVFFNSLDEIKAYVKNSLETCADENVKKASKLLVLTIIDDFDFNEEDK